jgi:rod shape-determining protein MreC
MDTFMGRYRNLTILAAAVFIQLIGLAVQVKRKTENESNRLIRVWTISAITPLEKGIVRLQTGGSNVWHNYVYLRSVRQENRDLKIKMEQLQLEQVRLQQDAAQARRLQSLLGFKEQFIDQTVAAQVIGSSGSEQSRLVYLDKGWNAGIKEGMPVISAEGIVGKVILAEPRASQVLLINDQTSGVGTILEHSRLQGVLKGRASGELVLDNVMAEEDVKAGERVLTSGGDQIFPKGLPVGTVGGVKRGSEFLQVIVKPAALLNHLEEVLVITKKQERQPETANVSSVRASDILAQRLPSVPDKPAETEPGRSPASGVVAPKPATAITIPSGQPLVRAQVPAATASQQAPTRTGAAVSSPAVNNSLQPKSSTAAGTVTTPKPGAGQGSQTKTSPAGVSSTKPAATTTQPPPQSDTGDAPQ